MVNSGSSISRKLVKYQFVLYMCVCSIYVCKIYICKKDRYISKYRRQLFGFYHICFFIRHLCFALFRISSLFLSLPTVQIQLVYFFFRFIILCLFIVRSGFSPVKNAANVLFSS